MSFKELLKAIRLIQQVRNNEISYEKLRSQFSTDNLNYASAILDRLEYDHARNTHEN